MNNQGGMTDYEKESMRAASEITKGIVSNPNVQISIQGDVLFFSVGGENRNIGLIFKNALEGARQGIMETK